MAKPKRRDIRKARQQAEKNRVDRVDRETGLPLIRWPVHRNGGYPTRSDVRPWNDERGDA